jgi:class 3 adenylate cyclase/pimeloyl-ACP methyl ester carboxylesterase
LSNLLRLAGCKNPKVEHVEVPPVSYVGTADGLVAWQSWGEGDATIIDCGVGPVFSLDDIPDEPHWLHYMSRLAAFARVLVLDYPGTGLSDQGSAIRWDYAELAKVVGEVLDAASAGPVTVLGAGAHSPMALQFAADQADRVDRLVLVNPLVRFAAAPDLPAGLSPDTIHSLLASIDPLAAPGTQYGEDDVVLLAPSHAAEPAFRSWWSRSARRAASPIVAAQINRTLFEADFRATLGSISAPTLVLQRRGLALFGAAQGRYVSQHLAGCRYLELDGADFVPFCGDFAPVVDEIREFVTGSRYGGTTERAFAVLLFTDIVGSTALAGRVGDKRWREIQHLHHDAVGRVVARHEGRLINDLGDGMLCSFTSPGGALRAALAIREAVRPFGLQIKCGLHAGEIELRGSNVAGINVHIAARVAALAQPAEILVSSTLTDLVAGSGFVFRDRGEHEMKGLAGLRRVWAVQ